MVPQPQQTEGSALAYGPVEAPAPPPPSYQPESHQPLNTHEAARYLGMSESWLRQSRMAGGLSQPPPWHVIGNRAIRYFRHELDGWLAHRAPCGNQCKPAPEAPPPKPAGASPKPRPGRRAHPQQRRGAAARPRSSGGRRAS